jgi:hypothetical protein
VVGRFVEAGEAGDASRATSAYPPRAGEDPQPTASAAQTSANRIRRRRRCELVIRVLVTMVGRLVKTRLISGREEIGGRSFCRQGEHMKRAYRSKLSLSKETVRQLQATWSGASAGAMKVATDDTDPFQCPTATCPSVWDPCP